MLPSAAAAPMGCAGSLPLLHACGSGSESEQEGWCLQPQVQQLVVKPPRALPAACLLSAVPSWVNLGVGTAFMAYLISVLSAWRRPFNIHNTVDINDNK